MLKKTLVAALVLGLSGTGQVMAAGSGSGTVALQIVLTPACSITTGPSDTLAVLDFGQVKTEWHSVITADAEAMLSLTCSDGVSNVTVALDGGVRGDRTLAPVDCTGECQTVPYRVFRDNARTIEYVINEPQGFAIPVSALGETVPMNIPLHGSIAPGTASAWGEYADTLIVTIDFN